MDSPVSHAPDPHPLERTSLSWQRTSIALGASGVVLARLFAERAPFLSALALAVTVVMAVITWRISRRRMRSVYLAHALPITFSGRTVLTLSLATSVLALTTVVSLLTDRLTL